MSLGPWKKYKEKVIRGVDGKRGYIFHKRVAKDSNGGGLICVPRRFVGKKVTLVIMDYGEEVDLLNRDIEEVDLFK